MLKHLREEKGFTLIELLIVVIILAVLAAIVIPQLRSSSTDAKISALDTDLSTIRSAIELYYHQHDDTYPGATGTTKTHKDANGNVTNHASYEQAFTYQLIYCSDKEGNTSVTCDATYKYGPYLKKNIPENPLPNSNTTTEAQKRGVYVDTTTTALNSATANDTISKGWYYVVNTGEFFANNTNYDNR